VVIQRLIPDDAGVRNAGLKQNDLDRLWSELGAADVKKRYQAIWTLAANPAAAGRVFKDRLRPGKTQVESKAWLSVIRVLELIDTAESRRLLDSITTGAFPETVKEHALAAVNRLNARERLPALTVVPD
jgi:hypothetical protein